MKSTAELIKGTERNHQGRARTVAAAGIREGLLTAADEIETLVLALVRECEECPVGDAVMSWVTLTRETAKEEQ